MKVNVREQYRIGRDQLFSFGQNSWRTSTFKMEVDVKNKGLKYELQKNMPNFDGCEIVILLYDNPIGSWSCPSIDSLKEKIQQQIEYVEVPVYFNDKQLNRSPKGLKWTEEDDDAYYLFNIGEGVKIYNMGAYVKTVDAYIAGTSGVIISKKMLGVNFARNDIQSDCKVFANIQEVIKKHRKEKAKETKKYTSLTDYERHAIVRDIRDNNQSYRDIRGSRIFRTSQGKWLSINMFLKDNRKWTFAPCGHRTADMAMERGSAICFDEEILNYLNYSDDEKDFFDWLFKNMNGCYVDGKIKNQIRSYIPFEDLENSYDSTFIVFPPNKFTALEKRVVNVLNSYCCWKGRQIGIGKSDVAWAWTDGQSYINLDREYIKSIRFNSNTDVAKLFTILIHEMSHDDDDEGTHGHRPEFYEKFYELSCDGFILGCNVNFKDALSTFQYKERQNKIEDKQKKKK